MYLHEPARHNRFNICTGLVCFLYTSTFSSSDENAIDPITICFWMDLVEKLRNVITQHFKID